MNEGNKSLLTKYIICFCVASAITFVIIWIRGFFTDDIGVNIQILSDGFSVAGLLFLIVAGMLFVSSEGALIGIGFVMRNIVQAFIPMGRKHHEFYGKYRERKMAELEKANDGAIFVTGLVFLLIGIVFTVIWRVKYYNVVG